MAAYAALVTLINLIEDMQNHPRLSISLDKKQIKSLGEKVHFLLNFIESYKSHGGSKEAEDLERQIASAAQEAEDVIELHIVDRILAGSDGDGEISSSGLLNYLQKERSRLQQVMEKMDSIKKNMVEIEKKAGLIRDDDSVLATSSRPSTSSVTNQKKTMEGFDDELMIQLMDELNGQQPTRQIISIVGVGGIGKTTLTRNAFKNSLIVEYFDIRSWVTVSQECISAREILLELLSEEKSTSASNSELGNQLYKSLLGKRYLIVLDDMWSIDAWDEIRLFLPNNGRIVITTRLSNLASQVSPSPFVMKLLDKEKSWKLFCEKAFGEDEYCPPELEEIGKEIVEQCQGLPLSIIVIGGCLSKSSWTKEHWECIANDINTVLSSGEDDSDQCLKILCLIYIHLPVYLKPCFLYLGIFSEDLEFSVSMLIRLWVAEGFLKPNKVQTPEEIAESYFNDLVDRNLISAAHTCDDTGKMIVCKIHDLVRELCLSVAEKEKFLCVLNLVDTPRPINRERRVVIQGGSLEDKCDVGLYCAPDSSPLVRSLICDAGESNLPSSFKLLKIVTGVTEFEDESDPDWVEGKFHQQVNLRYVERQLFLADDSLDVYLHLPSSISLLWNLQTLVLSACFQGVIAPPEIWEMPQLRHLIFDFIHLPDPPLSDHQHDVLVLRNLQTLEQVLDFRLSEEVCKRIPSIKILKMWYGVPGPGADCLNNLGRLSKLESLNCHFAERVSRVLAPTPTFPSSLRELFLLRCYIHWDDLTIIGSLPLLEVLKLGYTMAGEEWNPIEGEFRRLKFLQIWWCEELINWNADKSHFPVLERLCLSCFPKLAEIPSGIGEIPTLGHLLLAECGVPAAVSAMRILVEQESLGNHYLQLKLQLWHQEDHQSFREMVHHEGLNSDNLHLSDFKYRVGEKKSKKEMKGANEPNKPKRPPRAFFIFMENFMQQNKEKHPNKSISAIVKAGGNKWKSMSVEEKASSVAEAEKGKEQYGQKMDVFNKNLARGSDDDSGKSESEVDYEDEEEGSGEFSRLYEAFESLILDS